ncbi:hypothetical protein [Archangium violaceum]|uniref:hypothetical protein n=1 Tax=Archangium violaceum TaxID=83451 RepID=UPI0036DAD628
MPGGGFGAGDTRTCGAPSSSWETLAGLELTPEQVERARGLADRTFALFHAMGDELLAYARRGLEGPHAPGTGGPTRPG